MKIEKRAGLAAFLAAVFSISASAQEPADTDIEEVTQATDERTFLRWPLPATESVYGSIDGSSLKRHVDEITAISRRSRDAGEQYWGRIAGTPYDRETQEWVLTQFRRIGLANVRRQELDLTPQWMPASWDVTVQAGAATLELGTAHPILGSVGTAPAGLELDAVYAGLGTPADFAGRDVRGKAVFLYSIAEPGVFSNSARRFGAAARAQDLGAAAIFIMLDVPGNIKTQMWSAGTSIPTFSLGHDDGTKVRELIEQGGSVKVRLRMDVSTVPGLQSANILGTLPGTSDEHVVIMAHHDAFFEGADDNASGLATMIGLAEHFAKRPATERRRTLWFVAVAGHHAGSPGSRWLHDTQQELFAKTALIINSEHTAAVQMYRLNDWKSNLASLRKSNLTSAVWWYVGGSDALSEIVVRAFDRFGVATYMEPDAPPLGDLAFVYMDAPSTHVIDAGPFYHSDHATSETVPAPGIEAVTRAYAKIIDDVNRLNLPELQQQNSAISGSTEAGQ